MHDLATMSERERRAIVEDFLDATFARLDIDPGFQARMRAALPALPESPSPGQLEAWIEPGELVQDRILAALGGDGADRGALAARLRTGTDARAERYWQLLARINGWPEVPTTVPAWEWAIAALEA